MLLKIAEVYFLKNEIDKSFTLAKKVYIQIQQEGDRDTLWQVCSLLSKLNLASKKYSEAFEFLNQAINTIEFMRQYTIGGEQDRQLFLEDKVEPYRMMIDLLIRQNRGEEAFVFAERSKARVLLDVMQYGRISWNKNLTVEETEKFTLLNERLTKINIALRQAEQLKTKNQKLTDSLQLEQQSARLDYETFQAETYIKHLELQKPPTAVIPLQSAEAANLLLDSKTAILEYAVTEEKTYLFVLTKNNTAENAVWQTYTINIRAEELASVIEDFRRVVAEPDPYARSNDYQTQGQQLYKILLADAAGQLKDKTSLIVVPDAELWSLPFQALYHDGRFLIEDSSISYVPSLAVLREIRKQKEVRENISEEKSNNLSIVKNQSPVLLAFGNPSFENTTKTNELLTQRDQLVPLPAAEVEVDVISQLYKPSTLRKGVNATEEDFKRLAKDYRILHFATHGLVFDDNPLYSYIALAQPKGDSSKIPKNLKDQKTLISPAIKDEIFKEDGILEAREIMNLNFKADLAVLSACKTGLGRIGKGEGMIGLTWAFASAGVPTTVASLWSVNSCSTSSLMLAFHQQSSENLRRDSDLLAPAEALRQATLMMLRREQPKLPGNQFSACNTADFRHPYFWAGFIVVGSDR